MVRRLDNSRSRWTHAASAGGLMSLVASAWADAQPTSTAEVLDFEPAIFAQPFATTVQVAADNGVAVTGFAPWIDRRSLAPGDTATILITATGAVPRQQWLIELRVADKQPEVPDQKPDRLKLFTNSGRELVFPESPVVLAMRTWGPLLETPTDSNTRRRMLEGEQAQGVVNETFLGLGLANACRAMMRLHEARTEGRVAPDNLFAVGREPFDQHEIERGKQLAGATGFDLDDKRAIAAAVPALLEYFEVASQTPGIRRVVWNLIEKPSVWSVMRRIGRIDSGITFHSKGVTPVQAAGWNLPAPAELYKIPFTLEINDRPGLHCVLITTTPRPPLLISAGIVGLSVQPPDDDTKRLFLRVIAAHAASSEAGTD